MSTTAPTRSSGPTAMLKSGREKSLRRRHPWIFSGGIADVTGDPEPGAVVRVVAADGEFLAWAAWSPQSNIRLRVFSFEAETPVDATLIVRRIEQAVAYRRALGFLDAAACRLVFGESDGLPGLVIDRYGDYLVCQFLAASIEPWRSVVTTTLGQLLRPAGIVERSDAAMRRREGLGASGGLLAGSEPPALLDITIDGLRQQFSLGAGQKTGGYLDQRENRARIARHAAGRRVLDAYSYTGGFGLQCLKSGASEASFVDSSAHALETLAADADRNGLGAQCRIMRGDVPETLRELAAAGERFDLIVLDPPKFAQTAGQVTKACRAYKDINRFAFSLLADGGLLASFSCSGHIDAVLLQKVIAQAAVEAGRDARIVERLGQPADHPVALAFPESEYLKGFVVHVSDT